jgi:protein-S-isoprenylcysteine O-methyltransferase Ste14
VSWERENVKATAFEFRFRVILISAILVLGFWAPWVRFFQLGSRTTAWLWLGFQLGEPGIAPSTGIRLATIGLIAVAGLAAVIRVWGTAYLGPETVNKHAMVSGQQVLADGPYRYVRNPLYWGVWLMSVAIAGLMPISGAVVALVLLALFLLRLILGEEAFLRTQLGAPYEAYRRTVPRLIPVPKRHAASGGRKPDWGRALMSELFPLGVFLSYALLSWQFNAMLLTRAILVCFGLSLVVRAALSPGDAGSQRSSS